MKLSDLTRKRQEHIKSCHDNNDNSHKIIASLYSDPSHFIYELLQNADDAGASEVIFFLKSESLSVKHNGKKLFDIKDVDSITTVGSSTKKEDVNLIGTFGAGFKSVFAITKTPSIHSGDYHFEIVDFIMPKTIKPINTENGWTEIILPFNNSGISPDKTYSQISNCLQTLESESLLFLRNIKKIQWRTKTESGHYLSKINGNKANLTSKINENEDLIEYFLFTKDIEVGGTQLNIAVAYLLNDEQKITPVLDSKLFVFFPTNERTGLKFLVHAPYKTTPSRETIPFDDEQNKYITKELSKFIAQSVINLKDNGLLNVDVLSMLPIDSEEKHLLYESAFNTVKSIFKNNALLPTATGNYENAGNTILAREKELTNLLEEKDCLCLFDRNFWLNTNITYDKTPELRGYLTEELEIPEITMQAFCSGITEKFITTKPDKWLIKFYAAIINNEALYRSGSGFIKNGVLRERPIIRLEDNSHINPENDLGNIQVYLPATGESKFKTVKRVLAKNKEAHKFLQNLGLEKPDNVAEIQEFIVTKYQGKTIKVNEYKKDIQSVLTIWNNANEYQKDEISDLLSQNSLYSCCFVRCKNQIGDIYFKNPKDTNIYFYPKTLADWFDGGTDETLCFVNIGCKITINIKDFFKRLGVNENLRIIEEEDLPPKRWNIDVTDYRYFKRINGFNPYIRIDGLEYSLKNINKGRSTFLWQLLLTNNPGRLHGQTKIRTYLHEEFKTEVENSKILDLLQENYWLYNKKSILIKQPLSEILLDDLSDDYNKESDDVEKLVKALGLKLDEIAEFEAKTGRKSLSKEEYDKFQEWQQAPENTNAIEDKAEWTPEVEPDATNPIVDNTNFKKRKSEDLSGQSIKEKTNAENTENPELDGNDNNSIPPYDLKAIGDWGEKVANNYLKEKYPQDEVIWLNKSGNVGKGYDFVIKDKDNEEVAYYEVKSKTDELPKVFQISGTQWNYAKYLYNSLKGDMYRILVISNAGTKQPKIRIINNPVDKWKTGKIYASVISIEL